MEKDYKASVDKLQQLLESKIDLCQQQLRAEAECLQPETQFHAPEQHNQQLVTCDVSSVKEAIRRSVDEMAKCQHILRAFEITADARAAYRKALTEEKQLLEDLPASWQQFIYRSSVLVQCTRQRLQQRCLGSEQKHAEAYIRSPHAFMSVFCCAHLLWQLGCCRPALQQPSLPAQTTGCTVLHNKSCVCRDVKRQGQEIRHMQSLQRHGKQAIAAAPMLQERHRDFMRKLIRAKAELQILQLDGKQVENRSICCIAPHYPASTYHYAQDIQKELCVKTWCNHTLTSALQ